MAICRVCKQEMSGEGVSCTGDELSGPRWDGDENCPDCNCPPGGLHHVGCDMERCKECGEQMIGFHKPGCKVAKKIGGSWASHDHP